MLGAVVALRDVALTSSVAAVAAVTINVACRTMASPEPSYPTGTRGNQ